MRYEEINDMFRHVAKKIMSMGFNKTNLAKIIFGSSSYPMFLRFMNPDERLDFGIKPLSKAADVLGYEVHLVFIDPKNQDQELVDMIIDQNKTYIKELEDYLIRGMSAQINEKKKRQSTLDKVIDDFVLDPDITIDENSVV